MPAIHPEAGIEFIGKPADWGKQQAEEYEQHRYHQPSDEFEATRKKALAAVKGK